MTCGQTDRGLMTCHLNLFVHLRKADATACRHHMRGASTPNQQHDSFRIYPPTIRKRPAPTLGLSSPPPKATEEGASVRICAMPPPRRHFRRPSAPKPPPDEFCPQARYRDMMPGEIRCHWMNEDERRNFMQFSHCLTARGGPRGICI